MYSKLYSAINELINIGQTFGDIMEGIDEHFNSLVRENISLYVNDPQNIDLKYIVIRSLAGYLENSANNDLLLFTYSNDEDDEVDVENPLRISIVSKNWDDFEMKYELCISFCGEEIYFDEDESVKGIESYIDLCFKHREIIDF
jgi:hypothetical protein